MSVLNYMPEDQTWHSNAEGIVLYNFIHFAGCLQNSMPPLNHAQPMISSNHFSSPLKCYQAHNFPFCSWLVYYTWLFDSYLHLLDRSQFSTITSTRLFNFCSCPPTYMQLILHSSHRQFASLTFPDSYFHVAMKPILKSLRTHHFPSKGVVLGTGHPNSCVPSLADAWRVDIHDSYINPFGVCGSC